MGTFDGGSGDDHLEGLEAGALLAGSGDDTVSNLDVFPAARIDCGSGHDAVSPNGATDVGCCEETS
ncbi:MAG TPA: hypothetical protein VH482_22270 [Thermomicrobiales bacterium]|jgi:hypothetical protein